MLSRAKKRSSGARNAPPTAVQPAARLLLAKCELPNEHTNERTNKYDGSQYLLAELLIVKIT